MKLISLKCPDCGANLDVDAERSFCFCQYCGHKILIDDEVRRSEVTHVLRDEARIREAEVEIEEIELEREWRNNRKKSIRRWFIVCSSSLIIGILLFAISDRFDPNYNISNAAGIFFSVGAIGFTYGGMGYFIALLSHNKQLRKRRRK